MGVTTDTVITATTIGITTTTIIIVTGFGWLLSTVAAVTTVTIEMSPLLEIAPVFVGLDHIASRMVDTKSLYHVSGFSKSAVCSRNRANAFDNFGLGRRSCRIVSYDNEFTVKWRWWFRWNKRS